MHNSLQPKEIQEPNLTIGNHTIKKNNIYHLLVIDQETIIKLTPTEYCLIEIFIAGGIYDDMTLSKKALHTQSTVIDKATKEALKKHIANIRGKIRPAGLDIYRIQRYGYILTASSA
jgi:DNA-binding response OmpR family regulator